MKVYFNFKFTLLLFTIFFMVGCMDYGPFDTEKMNSGNSGLFIVNEGNFTYGNASLSYYDPIDKTVENEVFVRVNGIKLGDVAQSMVIRDGLGYIVVNNSGVIFVIDIDTFELKGKITGLLSPRYIHFLSDEKAYVTDLYAFSITVINPKTFEIIKRIPVNIPSKDQPSTEQMVQYKNFVFTNCWSYDNKILVIDTTTDSVVDYIEVGKQPTSLIIDRYNKLWTITDGGYTGSPYGQEAPALYCIDAESRKIEKTFEFNLGESGSELCLNGNRDSLYFINKHVWKMSVKDNTLPSTPFLENNTQNHWYGLTVDPYTSEVYLADAIDYMQPGMIYRYSSQGELTDKFKVGIIPGAFCFKEDENKEQ